MPIRLPMIALIFAFYVLIFGQGMAFMLVDPDTYWHIAAGDVIRSTGALPQVDPWSFTAGTERWYNLSWLYDVLLSLLNQHFGLYGATLLSVLLAAFSMAITYANCRLRGASVMAALLTLFVMTFPMLPLVRPQQVSYVIIPLLLALDYLSRLYAKPLYMWLAVPLLVLWANTHGAVFVGLMLIGAHVAERWRMDSLRQRLQGVLLFGCALSAVFINPYGIGIIAGIYRTLGSAINVTLSEWQPLRLDAQGMVMYAYMVLFMLFFAVDDKRFSRIERSFAALWLIAAFYAMRNVPVFILITAPLLALRITPLIAASPTQAQTPAWFTRLEVKVERMMHSCFAQYASLAMMLAVTLAVFSPSGSAFFAPRGLKMPFSLASEINYIETHCGQARILNYYGFGGYLIFEGKGKIKPFIDGRAGTAYPESLIRDHMQFITPGKDWQAILDKYRVDAVLVPLPSTDDVLANRFANRSDWKAQFTGPLGVVYTRADSEVCN